MAIKFGMTLAQIFNQLVRGYQKIRGTEPKGLDLIKIKQEAMQRFKDMNKVVDMKGNVIDTSKGIMGGQQVGQKGMFDNIFARMQKDMGKNLKEVKTKNRPGVFGLDDYDISNMSSIKKEIIKTEQKLGNLNPDSPGFREKAKELTDKIIALKNKMRDDKAMGGRIGLKEGEGIMKMASVDDPFYRDSEGDRDEHSFRMFNKPYKELNTEELEEFQEEMMRLMNKFSSYDYNDAMGEAFEEFLRLKKIKEIPEDMEFDEYLDQLDIDIPYSKKDKGAPSMMMASAPDPMDERNTVMENIATSEFGRPLKDLSEDEIIQIEEMMEEMTKIDRGAPSITLADGGRAAFKDGKIAGFFKSLRPFSSKNKYTNQLEAILYGSEGLSEGLQLLSQLPFYAEGGRIGYKDGPKDPKRRTFMKAAAGLASLLPFGIGKGVKMAAPVVAKAAEISGPALAKLVDTVMSAGKLISVAGKRVKEMVTKKKLGKVEVTEDIQDGSYIIKKDGKEIYYKPGRQDETGGFEDDIIEVIEKRIEKAGGGGIGYMLGE